MASKYGCSVKFFATSLLTMRAYIHVHILVLWKRNNLLIDRKDVNCFFLIKRTVLRWVLCSVLPFKSFCSALWLINILVVNDEVDCGRLWNSLGHGEHIYIWFPSTLLHC